MKTNCFRGMVSWVALVTLAVAPQASRSRPRSLSI
jgi:hypothetical protein